MVIYGSNSDTGKVRTENQDYYGHAVSSNGEVFLVCDGMGGHAGGEIAAKIAVESIIDFFKAKQYENLIIALNDAILYANARILDRADRNPELRNMGTTLVIVLISNNNELYFAHIGDSRIYILSKSKLYQLTKDHSYVQYLIDSGTILESEGANHPQRNKIQKALGLSLDIQPTVCEKVCIPTRDDIIMLCTDGLLNHVVDQDIEKVLIQKKLSLQDKTDQLIELANLNGGSDNITVQLIQIPDSQYNKSQFKPIRRSVSIKKTSFLKKKWVKISIISVFLILILSASIILLINSNENSKKEYIVPEDDSTINTIDKQPDGLDVNSVENKKTEVIDDTLGRKQPNGSSK